MRRGRHHHCTRSPQVKLRPFAPPNPHASQVFEGKLVGYDISRQEITLSIVGGSRFRPVECLSISLCVYPLHGTKVLCPVCVRPRCGFFYSVGMPARLLIITAIFNVSAAPILNTFYTTC